MIITSSSCAIFSHMHCASNLLYCLVPCYVSYPIKWCVDRMLCYPCAFAQVGSYKDIWGLLTYQDNTIMKLSSDTHSEIVAQCM